MIHRFLQVFCSPWPTQELAKDAAATTITARPHRTTHNLSHQVLGMRYCKCDEMNSDGISSRSINIDLNTDHLGLCAVSIGIENWKRSARGIAKVQKSDANIGNAEVKKRRIQTERIWLSLLIMTESHNCDEYLDDGHIGYVMHKKGIVFPL